MILTEAAFKKELSLHSLKNVYLLFGDEAALLLGFRRRLLDLLGADTGEVERIEAKRLDLSRLWEDAQLIPLFGGRRVFSIEDLEPETLTDADCKTLCSLIADLPDTTVLLISARAEALDPKKGKRAKALLAAGEAAGVVARLDRRSGADLKNGLRSRCQKQGCELSADEAGYLIERCGDDLGVLNGECDKLCAYVGARGVVTKEHIIKVCPPSVEGDVYALSRLLLRGEAPPALREIDQLMRLRHPVALLLSTLGMAFCDLYRAACARAAARDAAAVAKDFAYRFDWKVKNAFRDSSRLDPRRLLAVCSVLCEAEGSLKSGTVDDRALLESTVISCLLILRGERAC